MKLFFGQRTGMDANMPQPRWVATNGFVQIMSLATTEFVACCLLVIGTLTAKAQSEIRVMAREHVRSDSVPEKFLPSLLTGKEPRQAFVKYNSPDPRRTDGG